MQFLPAGAANLPTISYLSFATATSTSFGDVTPLHAMVRTLANVEAVIGQLFPARLLARPDYVKIFGLSLNLAL